MFIYDLRKRARKRVNGKDREREKGRDETLDLGGLLLLLLLLLPGLVDFAVKVMSVKG